MEFFEIEGGVPLQGGVRIHGAKNSALPILAACVLAPGESVIHACPVLSDTAAALDILACLGCRVRREGETVLVDASCLKSCAVPDAMMGRMRASVLFLGALLAREGRAEAGGPGGCALGDRPIDLHFLAFRRLGAQASDREGKLTCRSARLRGGGITLPFPSVGATENAMLAACGALGDTVIRNAAREPEILDLQGFLRAMGASVTGAGTECIRIRGGMPLHPAEYTVMPDRIVAATYLCAAASAGGEIEVLEAEAGTLTTVLRALEAGGCRVRTGAGRIGLLAREPLRGVGRIRTGPYPGFPTDAQPLLTAALAGGTGITEITETVFDRRFGYLEGLRAMGADVQVRGETARVVGRPLHGAGVRAKDLRGGAALTIAALGAEGVSRIRSLSYLDRGYQALEEGLNALGARIRRRQE